MKQSMADILRNVHNRIKDITDLKSDVLDVPETDLGNAINEALNFINSRRRSDGN